MPNPSKTGPDRIQRRERQADALRLRAAGKPVLEIAAKYGVAKTTVYGWIQDALRDTIREPAEEFIALELVRYDRLLTAIWPDAMSGDVKASAEVRRIMEARGKLAGIPLYVARKALEDGRDLGAVDQWLDHMVGKAIKDTL